MDLRLHRVTQAGKYRAFRQLRWAAHHLATRLERDVVAGVADPWDLLDTFAAIDVLLAAQRAVLGGR